MFIFKSNKDVPFSLLASFVQQFLAVNGSHTHSLRHAVCVLSSCKKGVSNKTLANHVYHKVYSLDGSDIYSVMHLVRCLRD